MEVGIIGWGLVDGFVRWLECGRWNGTTFGRC